MHLKINQGKWQRRNEGIGYKKSIKESAKEENASDESKN